MPRVDDFGKLEASDVVASSIARGVAWDGNVFLVDPHIHLIVKLRKLFTIIAHNSGNSGTPIPTTNDTYTI